MAHDDDKPNLLAARYRENVPQNNGPWNEAIATLLAHRSVRAFLPTPISESWLAQIIAAAQSAATSSNLQAWSVVAVREPARKQRLSILCADQEQIREAPLFLAWLADLSRIRRLAEKKQARLDGADYLEAFLLAVVDATLAAQNAAAAAESLGLGICHIGSLRDKPEEIAAELNLPPKVIGIFGMCVGHPDPARPASIRPRLPQEAVLHFEQYGTAKEAEAISAYNRAHRAFQAEQNMRQVDWSDRMIERLGSCKALHGRDRLMEALRVLGFALK